MQLSLEIMTPENKSNASKKRESDNDALRPAGDSCSQHRKHRLQHLTWEEVQVKGLAIVLSRKPRKRVDFCDEAGVPARTSAFAKFEIHNLFN